MSENQRSHSQDFIRHTPVECVLIQHARGHLAGWDLLLLSGLDTFMVSLQAVVNRSNPPSKKNLAHLDQARAPLPDFAACLRRLAAGALPSIPAGLSRLLHELLDRITNAIREQTLFRGPIPPKPARRHRSEPPAHFFQVSSHFRCLTILLAAVANDNRLGADVCRLPWAGPKTACPTPPPQAALNFLARAANCRRTVLISSFPREHFKRHFLSQSTAVRGHHWSMASDLEFELASMLAQLPPAERHRLLRSDFNLPRAVSAKTRQRRKLKDLSFEEKLRILDELRKQAELQKGTRKSASPDRPPQASTSVAPPGKHDSAGGRDLKREGSKRRAPRFGGRATAVGVSYEARIAALFAVKMLAGDRSSVWEGVFGADIAAITMQTQEAVDDIVVELRGGGQTRALISAKDRSGSIPLTAKSPAFADSIFDFVRQFLSMSREERAGSRFVLAVPSTAGSLMVRGLLMVLDALRNSARDGDLDDFLRARTSQERQAMERLKKVALITWERESESPPTEGDMRDFLCSVHVEVFDFDFGRRNKRPAESEIRAHLADPADDAPRIWRELEHFFADVNVQPGLPEWCEAIRLSDCRGTTEQQCWSQWETARGLESRLQAVPSCPASIDRINAVPSEATSATANVEPGGRLRISWFGVPPSGGPSFATTDRINAVSATSRALPTAGCAR